MRARPLQLRYSPGCETLPHVIQGIEWGSYTQAGLVPPVPCVRPDCEDPGPLEPLPPARPALGAGLRRCLLGSGVVLVPRLSRRP